MKAGVELTVVIPAWNEQENLELLLPLLGEAVASLGVIGEIIVADHAADDDSGKICRREGARLLKVSEAGYGRALQEAFAEARGTYVITMDADLSHPSDFIAVLWENRRRADVLVASRYIAGGSAEMTATRRVLSRTLNWCFSRALSVPVQDLSSGFRLYRRSVLDDIAVTGRDFNVLQEILISAMTKGYRIAEVPFSYRRRESGYSHARLAVFAIQYLKTFGRMWKLRNSIEAGDYDRRAHDSRIPLQRWWQRRRHAIITGWARGRGPVLDIGCGSSRIMDDLPEGSVGIDPHLPSLRYVRRSGKGVAAGALPAIPVAEGLFATLICSQVIEHLPDSQGVFKELRRLLAPGGLLIIGTPDYGRLAWRITETLYRRLIPGGYADDHSSRYTCVELTERLEKRGFAVLDKAYIGGGELILLCRRDG